MIKVPIVRPDGTSVGAIDIDEKEFGGAVNKQLLHDVCLMHEANRRQGSASTKTRAQIAGSGRKLYRQKGTGNARVGDRRTAKRVGGGTAFGPKPRDFGYSMPKRARRLATRMALLSKFQDAEAVIVDGLKLDEIKTKRMAALFKALGLAGQSTLLTTDGTEADQHRQTYLSARNLLGVEVLPRDRLNAYEILRRKRLVLTRSAFEALRASPEA